MGLYIIRTVREKKRIVLYYLRHGREATVKKYQVSWVTLLEWVKLASKGGAPLEELLARKPKRHTVKDEAIVFVRKLRAEDPTITLRELKKRVKHIQDISVTTIWKATKGH